MPAHLCRTLHLHGVTDSWGPFYSSKSSIGLINRKTGKVSVGTEDVMLNVADRMKCIETVYDTVLNAATDGRGCICDDGEVLWYPFVVVHTH